MCVGEGGGDIASEMSFLECRSQVSGLTVTGFYWRLFAAALINVLNRFLGKLEVDSAWLSKGGGCKL